MNHTITIGDVLLAFLALGAAATFGVGTIATLAVGMSDSPVENALAGRWPMIAAIGALIFCLAIWGLLS